MRWYRRIASLWLGLMALVLLSSLGAESRIHVSANEATRIGKQIWKNECGGTKSGLVSWNKGEAFASLGIGHFLWFPKGSKAPYDESFPSLLKFLAKQKSVSMPEWLTKAKDCPWPSKAAFDAAKSSGDVRMVQLREFLYQTVSHQTAFILQRLEQSLPTMLKQVKGAAESERVKRRFFSWLRARQASMRLWTT